MCTKGSDVYLFIVPDWSEITLLAVILDHIEPGCTAWADGCLSYNRLSGLGYCNDTVNHSEHFVDYTTRANTQHIKRECVVHSTIGWLRRCELDEFILSCRTHIYTICNYTYKMGVPETDMLNYERVRQHVNTSRQYLLWMTVRL